MRSQVFAEKCKNPERPRACASRVRWWMRRDQTLNFKRLHPRAMIAVSVASKTKCLRRYSFQPQGAAGALTGVFRSNLMLKYLSEPIRRRL